MTTVNFARIPQLEFVWPAARPWIEEALKGTPEDAEHWAAQAWQGKALVWLIGMPDIQGAMVTQLVQYPKALGISVVALAGQGMEEWFPDVHEALVEYRNFARADFIEFMTQRKAARFLQTIGFEEASVTYRSYSNGWKESLRDADNAAIGAAEISNPLPS